ncbi:hypothetical protein HZI73_01420 [Vallitalea pronyensis]|uniref:beta-mannosidase n=1 Tax=Vallitalea pronyensis TaxID=1348613 RepID=A0A8J8MGA1_9FIRM|nr:glycoside hydrolase family 2 TIM barrel-domain containing protein [Vallitalea pronyensis]QUI21034.1 hypothetical protein HZI73_01420 [Vallitalea pronyensis]
MNRIQLDWQVGWSKEKYGQCERMLEASVPGAVQLDVAKAEGLPDYKYADHYKQYAWMEDVYWKYETTLDIPICKEGDKLFFVSKGIDYHFEIYLNHQKIFSQEGMFTPVELDMTGKAKSGDLLEIWLYPVPKRKGAEGRQQADQCCKPAVSYGWDWHPRLIPSGIWDDTYLEVRQASYIQHVEHHYDLDDTLTKAFLTFHITLSQPNKKVQLVLRDEKQQMIRKQEIMVKDKQVSIAMAVDNVKLWWPNGYGDPTLYGWELLLSDLEQISDRKKGKIGFRKVKLIMHEQAWEEPQNFPKSRSNPPITMEINHQTVFCIGTNWVNPEIFPGIITAETYHELVRLGYEAHMNMFRVWGGGIINKDVFYELCDAYGIMVWQEFPLSCNDYKSTPHYLDILEQEAVSIIKRLKKHPSLVLWCGGNELFNAWSGMTEQSHALRLLNAKCYELDRETPFLMTSPLSGMGHGHYLFQYNNDQDVLEAMIEADHTAYTEFGCPSPSTYDYLKTFIPAHELQTPIEGTAWEDHHAIGAWPVGGNDTWFLMETIKRYFGETISLHEMLEKGQLLQCIAYKGIYEEARRQKPRCSMALNWCYNEPWPTAANNSILNYPYEPKPAYYAVKDACRPVLASARIPKFSWHAHETLSFEIWVLNNSFGAIEAGSIRCYLQDEEKEVYLLTWEFHGIEPMMNRQGPTVRCNLADYEAGGLLHIKLIYEGHDAYSSCYDILMSKPRSPNRQGEKLLNQ